MFFLFSKILFFLIQPLNWVVGLVAYYYWGKHIKWKRHALLAAVVIIFVMTNPLLSNFVAQLYEEKGTPVAALEKEYDYGLLLGGFSNLRTEYNEDRLNLGMAPNRLSQTLDLYRQGKIKKILLSGGNGSLIGHQENEALITANFFKRLGIPAQDIKIDQKSRNTFENFKYSKDLLKNEADEPKILVVTSAFHVPRSRLIAKKAGVDCDFFATDFYARKWQWTPGETLIPNADYVRMWQVFIKEWVGIVAYKLKGYI